MKTLRHIAFCLCFASAALFSQSGRWEVVGNIPNALFGAEAVVFDSSVYVFGGYADSLQRLSDVVYKYNPLLNTWVPVAQMKRPRRNIFAARWNNFIIYYGGEAINRDSRGPVEVFNPETWVTAVVDSNRRFNRYRGALAVANNQLISAGGLLYFSQSAQNPFLFEYNASSKQFTYFYDSLFSTSNRWYDMMSAVMGSNLYLLGGVYNTVQSAVYRYDFVRRSLVRLNGTTLSPRANGRAVKHPDTNTIFLIGGYSETSYLNTVEAYDFVDVNTFTRRTMPSLNFRRTDFMAFFYKGYIYVAGGYAERGEPVRQIERLQIITGIDDNSSAPASFEVLPGFPNPFNPQTTLSFSLGSRARVTVTVHDMLGNTVRSLAAADFGEGTHHVTFDASGLASGVYVARFAVKSGSASSSAIVKTQKLMLIK